MTWLIFAKLLVLVLALIGGFHALGQIILGTLNARAARRGRFAGPTREAAKAKLRFEFLKLAAAAKAGASTYDLSGADEFVDCLSDALKEEVTKEAASWQ